MRLTKMTGRELEITSSTALSSNSATAANKYQKGKKNWVHMQELKYITEHASKLKPTYVKWHLSEAT